MFQRIKKFFQKNEPLEIKVPVDYSMTATEVSRRNEDYWQQWRADSNTMKDAAGIVIDDPIVRTEEFMSGVDRRIEFDALCDLVSNLGHKSKQCHARRTVYPMLSKENPSGMQCLGKQVWWT
jgi:hypothetical protein